MRFFPASLFAIFVLVAVAVPAHAQTEDFVVNDISIVGLDKIGNQTVLAFVSFDKGDIIDEKVLAATVSRLFETGLFRNVEIFREGDQVRIEISENPTIRAIRFEGLDELADDRVTEILAGQDIAVGRVYKRGDDDFIEQSMRSLYRSQSLFLATAQVVTVPLDGNLIDLVIEVNEGEEVGILSINFFGNEVLDGDDIKGVFELKESGLLDSFFERDVYGESKLTGDLERLRREYLNRGHVRFEILSYDVSLDSENAGLVIDVFISEGAQYSFGDAIFSESLTGFDEEELRALATFTKGEVYSEQLANSYRDELLRFLRQSGHAFAQVDQNIQIDDANFAVNVKYVMIPDVVAEVRHINFIGNNLTQDLVLRQQLELVEGEVFDIDKLDFSLTRLRRSGYLTSVKANERRVGDDQVDVDIEVAERSQGALSVGAGFSNSDGLSFEVNFSRNNIFGTGNDIFLKARTEDDGNEFSATFREPNITDSGITRNVSFTFRQGSSGNTSSDDTGSLGGSLSYEIPIDRNWSWTAGAEAVQNTFDASTAACPSTDFDLSCAFGVRYGTKVNTLQLIGGLTYDSRDSSFNPTEGLRWHLGSRVAVPPSDASYYTATSDVDYYLSLDEKDQNILSLDSSFRYGDATGSNIFPYFRRFYLSSRDLRGFDISSIGPQDNNSNVGGRFVAAASAELERRVTVFGVEGARTGLFIDSAGIFDAFGGSDIDGEGYRVSAGLLLKIQTPALPLAFSYGFPLIKEENDTLRALQFNIGF